MESVKQQRITQSSTLKLATKSLLAVSFFSILLPVSLHYSNFQFFTRTIQLFSCNNDKNYMFLLCNGILVLIVKNAGLMDAKKNREDRSELQEMKAASVAYEAKGGVQEEQHVEEKSLIIVEESKCARSMMIEEEIKEQRNEIVVIDHEDDEDGFGSLTAEELNKKCDEFIRKMKEEIKFEA
ncbi:hypothetical protein HS088_TW06G00335 [Tripterygium wilfordii]|uniref:Uncharacterized protein n=1 Tax=Tripterygium wilfordii TaxID=458696 RepID=A0A7J7DIQ1_TRIWF|nr:uncharacterized protein LOC120000211 [Tripterygium wilfordii]KAF5746169.1 hypothetical protein HS088_TW06G00335 [Tripterygium wilfordii]